MKPVVFSEVNAELNNGRWTTKGVKNIDYYRNESCKFPTGYDQDDSDDEKDKDDNIDECETSKP
jgi:hypothetical protein